MAFFHQKALLTTKLFTQVQVFTFLLAVDVKPLQVVNKYIC